MTLIELLAALFSLASAALAAKNKTINWPIGIVGVVFYGVLFYQNSLYANMTLQGVFLVQSFYGWGRWASGVRGDDTPVTKINLSRVPALAITSAGLFVLTVILLTNINGSKYIIIDSLLATVSFIANYLLANKKIENWYLWIVADVAYVIFFFCIGLFISSFIYMIFLLVAIWGLLQWKKEIL